MLYLRPTLLPALLLTLPLALPLAQAALAGDLVVTLQGVASAEGEIRVAACPPEDYPAGTCGQVARAPAQAGSVQLRIAGLPEGRWGLSAYHDADGNGRLGQDWLGRPTEGVGFGNDAPITRLGPPGFEAAAVATPASGEARVAVTLRYR